MNMNILVTLNSGYIDVLCVMLKSLLISNPGTTFDVYVMNSSLTDSDFEKVKTYLHNHKRIILHDIKIHPGKLADAPTTLGYPIEMYYRIFAAEFLPKSIDRILYLDPDLVVLKPLDRLYNIDMENYFFAAASHVGKVLNDINDLRLNGDDYSIYINSGIMMMNLELLRKEQDRKQVFEYIENNKERLILPDQDVISAIYGSKILKINPFLYNMSDRLLLHPSFENGLLPLITVNWVKEHCVIVHYFGKNKPWKETYIGFLGKFYEEISAAPVPED